MPINQECHQHSNIIILAYIIPWIRCCFHPLFEAHSTESENEKVMHVWYTELESNND